MANHPRPLTAEEKSVGTDDPDAQSDTILEESERRALDREAAPDTFVEHRSSDEATAPPE